MRMREVGVASGSEEKGDGELHAVGCRGKDLGSVFGSVEWAEKGWEVWCIIGYSEEVRRCSLCCVKLEPSVEVRLLPL